MFTGIIEALGRLKHIEQGEGSLHFTIQSALSSELKIDQSIAHDGVCLTVTEILEDSYKITAVGETLKKTNLGDWEKGRLINLERAMILGSRIDGHLVQGHVDGTANCLSIKENHDNRLLRFKFPKAFAGLVIEKGSICINGVSLTVFDLSEDEFSVTIIPYTWEHTSFSCLKEGVKVNIEYDLLGKYLLRGQTLKGLRS